MSCGHDHCGCAPSENSEHAERTARTDLPVRGENRRRDDGCCGGHSDPPTSSRSGAAASSSD